MQATQYFNSPACNGQSSRTICHPKVKTVVHTKSQPSGLIIPAGTTGTILDVIVKDGVPCYLVDFGLLWVLLVPINSHLIEMER
jgi:hypothetical protein